MNILVAGSTGNTGTRLVNELVNRGHDVVALVRESSNTGGLPEQVEQRIGDLTAIDADLTKGSEVVIFAAGSGGHTGPEMTDKVDRDGAIDLIGNAEQNGVRRFVMLSSVGADNPDPDSDLAHYLEAKHAADERLKSSSLEYAILRPVTLTDDGPTGAVKLGDGVDPKGKAARGDVAVLLADAAEQDQWNGAIQLMETVS